MELAQQALETQRRQHEQVMGALTRLEQHLTGYSPAMQAQQVWFSAGPCCSISSGMSDQDPIIGVMYLGKHT